MITRTDFFQAAKRSVFKWKKQLLKKQGKFIITRGAKLDIGPGISHKTTIIELYFKGYTFTEIEQLRTNR
ncbi:MAG: DUF1670 domain-containing protein [Bacteroidetes bacterium]|nr:DUF1670 domain-containing protein [Bacteroidota bacterium]MBU2508086.1 DUF1670 domain-containing protein [Bacteroidota bacterium]